MIAENNKYMEEALQALYECNADDVIREQCLARVEQLAKENYYLRTIEEQAAELAQMQTELEQKDTSIAEIQTELKQKDTSIAEMHAELKQLRAQLANFRTKE